MVGVFVCGVLDKVLIQELRIRRHRIPCFRARHRPVRQRARPVWFLLESHDPITAVDLHNPELRGLGHRHFVHATVMAAPRSRCACDHAGIVHFVHMIAGKESTRCAGCALGECRYSWNTASGSAFVPGVCDPLLGQQQLDELVEAAIEERPAALHVPDEALRLVLGSNADAPYSEFTQLDSVKSMMRNLPPKGTEGLARARRSGLSRDPLPRPAPWQAPGG